MGKMDDTWLQKEVLEWKEEGIIDDAQVQKILARLKLAERSSAELKPRSGSSKVTTVISILGAVLVGMGAILFVASNWGRIPDALKMILLAGTTVSTYYAGWKLKYERKDRPALSDALLLLASIFVGVTIFLTAQILNVNADTHWLVFLWFLSILPLGYAFNSKSILSLNIFTFILWTFFFVGSGDLYLSIFEIFMSYLLVGVNLYGLGQLHTRYEKYARFRTIYQGFGLFFILLSYFFFSTETLYFNILTNMEPTTWQVQAFSILFAVTALVFIISSLRIYKQHEEVKYEFFILLMAFLGWAGTNALRLFSDNLTTTITDEFYSYREVDPHIATALFVAFNLILLILAIASILIGYHRSTVPFINIGMFFFVLGVLNLYFTTLYGLLPRSIAFIIGGLVLIALSWYLEKKRQSLIMEIKGGETTE